jgi:hypothetical protein
MSFKTIAKLSLPEIFAKAASLETVSEKIDFIKHHYSVSTAAVLSLLFNPNIKITLPKGIPDGFEFTEKGALSLEKAIRSFPSFVNTENTDRLQIGWLRLMRSLDRTDAEFAFKLKDKEVEIGLSQEDVHLAFPNLIPAPEKFQEDETIKVPVSEETPEPEKLEQSGDSPDADESEVKEDAPLKKPRKKKVKSEENPENPENPDDLEENSNEQEEETEEENSDESSEKDKS